MISLTAIVITRVGTAVLYLGPIILAVSAVATLIIIILILYFISLGVTVSRFLYRRLYRIRLY